MKTRLPHVLVLVATVLPHPAPAQSCTTLPQRANELWLAAGHLKEGSTSWREMGVDASPGDRFGVSIRRVSGGPEEDQGLEAWAGRVGIPFGIGVAGFCLFGGFELNHFSFEDRFEVDRGEAKYLAREIGLRGDIPVFGAGGVEMRVWIAPAVAFLTRDISGRTLVVDGQIGSEERSVGGSEWKVSGQGGLTLRWKLLGVSGGVSKRPALSSGTMAFVHVGMTLIRGGNGERSPPDEGEGRER